MLCVLSWFAVWTLHSHCEDRTQEYFWIIGNGLWIKKHMWNGKKTAPPYVWHRSFMAVYYQVLQQYRTRQKGTGQDWTWPKVNPALHQRQQCFHSGTVLCSVMSDQSDHSSIRQHCSVLWSRGGWWWGQWLYTYSYDTLRWNFTGAATSGWEALLSTYTHPACIPTPVTVTKRTLQLTENTCWTHHIILYILGYDLLYFV